MSNYSIFICWCNMENEITAIGISVHESQKLYLVEKENHRLHTGNVSSKSERANNTYVSMCNTQN